MDAVLQSQIFFFIASVATVILAILAGIALWHISRVAKNIHVASDVVRNEIIAITTHISETKDYIANIMSVIKDFVTQKTSKTKHNNKPPHHNK